VNFIGGITLALVFCNPSVTPPLRISLALPAINNETHPVLWVNQDIQYYVVLENVSNQSIKIWTDGNSWGGRKLEIRLFDAGNKVVHVKPKKIRYPKNYPEHWIILPGQTIVYPITLNSDTWNIPPSLREGKNKIQVILRMGESPEGRKMDVWSGQIESDLRSVYLKK
jgi:hypothetical protein